jgi:hypothetical protein
LSAATLKYAGINFIPLYIVEQDPTTRPFKYQMHTSAAKIIKGFGD